jgi:predicted PurR-regulated permease PerM
VTSGLPIEARWHRLLLILVGLASAVVVLAAARAAADLLGPVLMAGFLALLLQPLLQALRRIAGSAVAVGVVVLVVVLGGLALAGFVGVSLRQLALELPLYQEQMEALLGSVTQELEGRGIDAAGYVESALTGPTIAGAVLTAWRVVAGGVGSLLLMYFIFAFMLGGMWELERRANSDALDHSPLAARFLSYSRSIRGYMGVRAALGLAAAVLEYVLLLVLGVDYALLWAILSFLLSFVPNIGFALSMIPPLLLGLLSKGWVVALLVFAGYQVVNTVIDNIIGPRFIGRQMNISALVSFLSVIFWTWLLGATGALLAVPLTVLLQDLALGPRLQLDPSAQPTAAADETP